MTTHWKIYQFWRWHSCQERKGYSCGEQEYKVVFSLTNRNGSNFISECQFKLVNVSADQSVCHCTAGEKDALLFVVWVQFHICNCTDIVTEMIQMAVFVPWPGKQFRIYNASIIESSDAQFHGNFQSKSVNNSYFKDHYKEAHVFIYLQSSADGEVSLPSQGVFFKCKIFCPYK